MQEAPGGGSWQEEHDPPPSQLISDRRDDVTQCKNKLTQERSENKAWLDSQRNPKSMLMLFLLFC